MQYVRTRHTASVTRQMTRLLSPAIFRSFLVRGSDCRIFTRVGEAQWAQQRKCIPRIEDCPSGAVTSFTLSFALLESAVSDHLVFCRTLTASVTIEDAVVNAFHLCLWLFVSLSSVCMPVSLCVWLSLSLSLCWCYYCFVISCVSEVLVIILVIFIRLCNLAKTNYNI